MTMVAQESKGQVPAQCPSNVPEYRRLRSYCHIYETRCKMLAAKEGMHISGSRSLLGGVIAGWGGWATV